MVNALTGVYLPVYENMITKYGCDVVHTPITQSLSNIDGDETLTSGATATLRVYITRKTAPWTFDKLGLITGGDALMLVKRQNTVNKNDLITHNSHVYRIQNTINRDQPGGNVAFTSCNLFIVE